MSEAKFSILKPGDCRDDEELCVASVSDREAVMAIEPEGYAGYDYLPTKYEQFISGPPGVTGYLYKKQGKVVGFFSILLADGGQTLVTTAGRISMEWRGDGMYGRFKRRVFQRCLDAYPDLRYAVMGTHNLNWDINGNKLQKVYKKLLEKDIAGYHMDTTEAKQRVTRNQPEVPGVRQLTRDDLQHVLRECPPHLFPIGRIQLEVKAYRVMEANTDLIYSNGNDRIFLGSYKESTDSQQPSTPDVLSCGGFYQCSRGILYQMDAYGNDDTMMRAHIEWHLLRLLDLARTTGKDAFFNPSTPSDVSHIMDAFKDEFGIAKMDIPYKKGLLLEMELRPAV
nr:hypothetical protein BaRGS_028554 [Batillaria attramentaria]